MKYFILISICFFSFSSLTWGQSTRTTVTDKLDAKTEIKLRNGGTLIINGYSVRYISNDPTLGDSSNIDLVTEAAVNAYVKSFAAAYADNQIASEVPFTPTGSIAAINVQTALAEVDAEKLATASLLSAITAVDGSGSGLDADLLDGQSGAYYLAFANHTGTVALASQVSGTLPLASVPFGTANQLLRTNSGGTAAEWFTPSYLTANQTITLSGDVTGSGTTGITTTIGTGAVTSAKILDATIAAADLSAMGASSGQVMQWNGSAWVATTPTVGTTINSTNGYLPYRTSGTTFGNSAIYTDGTKTGFGTTVLTEIVNINGVSPVLRISNTSATAFFTHYIIPEAAEWSTGLDGADANKYKIASSHGFAAVKFGIAQSGEVAIGTTSYTEKLNIGGNIILTGIVKNADGSAASPAYSFTNDLDNGLYRPTTNTVGMSAAGTEVMRWSAAQASSVLGSAGTPSYSFTGDLNTGWFSPGADIQAWAVAGTEVARMSAAQFSTVLGSAGAPAHAFTGDLNNGWWSPSADVQAWSTGGTERMRLTATAFTTSNLANFDVAATSQWSAFVGGFGIYGTASGIGAQTTNFFIVNPIAGGYDAAQLRFYEDNDNPTPQYIGVAAPAVGANYSQTLSVGNGEIGVWLRATSTMDFPSTTAAGQSELTVSVTGAVVGQAVLVGVPVNTQGVFTAYVSATDTVTVRYTNTSGISLDPASGAFTVHVKI